MNNENDNPKLCELDLQLLEARCDDLRRRASSEGDLFKYLGAEILKEVYARSISTLPKALVEFCELDSSKRGAAAVEAVAGARSTGMSREGTGRRFWAIYKETIRNSLCEKDGELHKLFMREGKASTKAIIAALAAALGMGSMYGGVLCGLAVLLAQHGLEAFCEWTKPDKR